MHIALICPYSLSVVGGVQNQVLGLAHALRAFDVQATVLAPGDERISDADTRTVGRTIGVRVNGSVAPVSPWPTTWRRTLRELRAGSFDIVHVHEPFVPGPALAALIGSPAPVVGTFHQSGWAWPYRLSSPIVHRLGRRLAAAVAVSEAAAGMVRGPLGREVEVLWNGVDLPEFSERRPEKASTIAFVGRHEERKGLEVLLRAMAHLPIEVRLWVMSDGPLTARLRAAYGSDSRVEWLGRVSDDERNARLASAAVFCAPNLGGESFGLVLAEAMACGAPVVASDLDAFRAVARPDLGEAVLVAPGDPVALAGGLRRVLDDPAQRARMRGAGAARAKELSMEKLARRYLEIYAAVSEGQLG